MTIPWTFLKIDGAAPLDKFARNIKASYKWIADGGEIVRLASGERRSLRRSQFRKLAVTINGDAVRKPALDHLHRGDTVVIDCPFHLDVIGDVADGALLRTPVPGSIYRWGQAGGKPVMLDHGNGGVIFTAFRPRLTIMLDEISVDEDEMAAKVTWSISGEEV